MSDSLGYTAMASGIVAAVLVSANLCRKITGYPFIVFTVSSVAWVAVGLLKGEPPLIMQNIALTGINLFGIYRWLIVKAHRLGLQKRPGGRISSACPDEAIAGSGAGRVDPLRAAGRKSKCRPSPQIPWPPPRSGCLSRGHAGGWRGFAAPAWSGGARASAICVCEVSRTSQNNNARKGSRKGGAACMKFRAIVGTGRGRVG